MPPSGRVASFGGSLLRKKWVTRLAPKNELPADCGLPRKSRLSGRGKRALPAWSRVRKACSIGNASFHHVGQVLSCCPRNELRLEKRLDEFTERQFLRKKRAVQIAASENEGSRRRATLPEACFDQVDASLLLPETSVQRIRPVLEVAFKRHRNGDRGQQLVRSRR